MTCFLIHDRHQTSGSSLVQDLAAAGHAVLDTGVENIETPHGDAVLLLFDDGSDALIEVIRRLRFTGFENGIIILRKSRDSSRTALLIDMGADDDVILPSDPDELSARAQALRRRSLRLMGNMVTIGDLDIFPGGRPPEFEGVRLAMSPIESAILHHLSINAERHVPRSAIHDKLYAISGNDPSERVVDVHICNIRRKLRKALGERSPVIETIRGQGYRLHSGHTET